MIKPNLACDAIARYGASHGTPTETLLAALGLPNAPLQEILNGAIHGLDKKTLAKCEAFSELFRRVGTKKGFEERMSSPREAGAYLLSRCQGWTEERMGILALNARGYLLADRILSQGTMTGTLISPREVMREALRLGALSVILYHNHPSGDPMPSPEDIALTRRIRAAGENLGISLSDHIIAGKEHFHSFRTSESWDKR